MPYPMDDRDRAWYAEQARQFVKRDALICAAGEIGTIRGILRSSHLTDRDMIERIQFFLNEIDKGEDENAVYAGGTGRDGAG